MMKTRVLLPLMLLGLNLCSFLNFSIAAESGYPTRPIEIIGGFAPGAGTDLGARMLAELSKKHLGQEILIVNKPGGAGRLSMILVAKANPDGYTLVSGTDSTIAFLPHIEKVPFKPLEDFTYIIQFGVVHCGVVVLSESPFRSFKELIEFARSNPDKLTVSTLGVGSATQTAFEAINQLEGLKIKIIPFSGAAPAMTALLGGHVMAGSTGASAWAQNVAAKKFRLLAVMSDERMEVYPDVPTLKELGYPLSFEFRYFIAGPKNMERPIVKKLVEAFRKGMESPEFIRLAKELEIWKRDVLADEELNKAISRRYKEFEELFKKLGMGIKQ
jgi:tripartite-type tricarboxylate transporter receptor subunit TctC